MSKGKIYFISLGCDKNLVDSEYMLGILSSNGYTITNDEDEADTVIVNTCGFIKDAQEESIETILEAAALKSEGRISKLIVAGCLSERYKGEILKEIPEVDAIVGTTAYDGILNALDCQNTGSEHFCDISRLVEPESSRLITGGMFSSSLKIAEGCDKRCTYCIIPSLRGSYRSYPMSRLIAEAKYLASRGVKELNIIAQETTVYGRDLYGKKMLPELLRKLCAVDGIEWVRLLYCYPEEITDELIDTIKSEPKICHYIDMPIQHSSDDILRRMGRHTNRLELEDIISRIRENIPDIVLRTTLITGFPGEIEEDHEDLMDFVSRMQFDRLGVFTYSAEDGTPAALFPDQVGEDVKEERRDAIMQLQQDIAFRKAEAMKGRVIKVLTEGRIPEDDVYVGRSYMDAQDIDGYVFFKADYPVMSGDFIDILITGAEGYDLTGVPAEEES
ncbi:MAG: 30S ribosomal protein S12 methylthiotransferase RimO [Lachnospiraceae bacterium]|nr:30S ribosomal protein S12 methylthiotransferase RimO [Lachnospiraceae bacterium]